VKQKRKRRQKRKKENNNNNKTDKKKSRWQGLLKTNYSTYIFFAPSFNISERESKKRKRK